MFVKACPNISPAFAGMNVRAVRQMDVARKLVKLHLSSLPLFKPVDGAADDPFVHFMDFHAAADSGKQCNCQFPAQMLLKVCKTFQYRRPPSRVALPKLVVPQD